jgi:hypothetical protein
MRELSTSPVDKSALKGRFIHIFAHQGVDRGLGIWREFRVSSLTLEVMDGEGEKLSDPWSILDDREETMVKGRTRHHRNSGGRTNS